MQPAHTPHIQDDVLEQYATGGLPAELLPSVDEHLLSCPACQCRLVETDEFIRLFRVAAGTIDLSPAPFWRRILRPVPLQWVGAAALLALSVAFVEVSHRDAHAPEAVVVMESLRGTDSNTRISAGKPALLIFDLVSPQAAGNYRMQILNQAGASVLETETSLRDGRLAASVRRIARGDYWVRLYRRDNNELLGEYSLRAD